MYFAVQNTVIFGLVYMLKGGIIFAVSKKETVIYL